MKEWLPLGLGILGFLTTWILGAFKLGRAVEQMRAGVREEIEEEREKIIQKIEELEKWFSEEQDTQDHRFGEVGAAMRQYIAEVEKKLREVELWARDHYVAKQDFKDALIEIGSQIREGNAEIKADLKELQKQLIAKRG